MSHSGAQGSQRWYLESCSSSAVLASLLHSLERVPAPQGCGHRTRRRCHCILLQVAAWASMAVVAAIVAMLAILERPRCVSVSDTSRRLPLRPIGDFSLMRRSGHSATISVPARKEPQ